LNAPAGLFTDEIEFMRRIVPLDGARFVRQMRVSVLQRA